MTEPDSESSPLSLDYHFSQREVLALARFFRTNQNSIPDDLIDFSAAVEHAVYNSLSIHEAEQFYSQ